MLIKNIPEVREAMARRHWTQADVAKALRPPVHYSTVSVWWNTPVDILRPSTVGRIADALGIPSRVIIFSTGLRSQDTVDSPIEARQGG